MKGLVLNAKWDLRPDYPLSGWEQETGKAITGNSVWRYPKLEVRDWPDPKPGPKEVVLAVQACGMCGSDMHFYETDEVDEEILLADQRHCRAVWRRGKGLRSGRHDRADDGGLPQLPFDLDLR